MPEQALTFVTCGSGGSLGGELTGITHGAKQVSPLLGIACLKKGEPSHDIAENKSHGSKLSWTPPKTSPGLGAEIMIP